MASASDKQVVEKMSQDAKIVDTKPFGEITIKESDILEFPDGIFAFEDYTRFIILAENEDSTFQWLQSIDDPGLAFVILEIKSLIPNYVPDIPLWILSGIGLTNLDDAQIWGIVTIPQGNPHDMTINLQGPVIINPEKRVGGQFISNDDQHNVRTKLLEFIEQN